MKQYFSADFKVSPITFTSEWMDVIRKLKQNSCLTKNKNGKLVESKAINTNQEISKFKRRWRNYIKSINIQAKNHTIVQNASNPTQIHNPINDQIDIDLFPKDKKPFYNHKNLRRKIKSSFKNDLPFRSQALPSISKPFNKIWSINLKPSKYIEDISVTSTCPSSSKSIPWSKVYLQSSSSLESSSRQKNWRIEEVRVNTYRFFTQKIKEHKVNKHPYLRTKIQKDSHKQKELQSGINDKLRIIMELNSKLKVLESEQQELRISLANIAALKID